MSRIAKGRDERPAVLNTGARADSQKRRSPVLFKIASSAPIGCGRSARRAGRTEGSVMRNGIDIDHIHSRAIVREIGERLRASLKPEPELPASLRAQIDRLREFEAAEHWNKPRG